jgi:hypothetical protein
MDYRDTMSPDDEPGPLYLGVRHAWRFTLPPSTRPGASHAAGLNVLPRPWAHVRPRRVLRSGPIFGVTQGHRCHDEPEWQSVYRWIED